MQCKIDHAEPLAVPHSMCRACNPGLNRTRAELSELASRDRAEQAAADALRAKRRDLELAKRKLAGLTRHGEPDPASVNGKIAASLQKKINRLSKELPRA